MLFAAVPSAIAQESHSGAAGTAAPTPGELVRRMHGLSKTRFTTARGAYVYRIFNDTPDAKREAEIAQLREALTKARQIRMANETTLGRRVDEAALDREIEANIAEFSAKQSKDGLQTIAVKYTQEGDSYRIEQFNLPNDVPLSTLAQELKSGSRKCEYTYTRTWNGALYAELLHDSESNRTVPAMGYDNRAKEVVKFTTFSRTDMSDPAFLEKLSAKGHSAKVRESKTQMGEIGFVLEVGDPDVTPIHLEIMCLPEKGYCVESASTRFQGKLLARDQYGEFVKTKAGFWLPTAVERETYGSDRLRSHFLRTREEMLAFELPETNVKLEAGVFDLSESVEFKAHPLSTHLLPRKNPYLERPAPQAFHFKRATLIVAANLMGFLALVFWIWSRHFRGSVSKA